MRKHVIDFVNLVEARVVIRYGQNLVIHDSLIDRSKDADRPRGNRDARIAGRVGQRQNIQRIPSSASVPGMNPHSPA